MRGWTDIGSDVSWDDYGGKWAKKARDGTWYVIVFENMLDCVGEREWGDRPPYLATVKRVALAELSSDQLRTARECVGANETDEGWREVCQVEACIAYGHGAPLEEFEGRRALSVRAQARRAAEGFMRDAASLAKHLARPVNAIGSTAAEYGRGDVTAALERGPFDDRKNLMRKLSGLPTLG